MYSQRPLARGGFREGEASSLSSSSTFSSLCFFSFCEKMEAKCTAARSPPPHMIEPLPWLPNPKIHHEPLPTSLSTSVWGSRATLSTSALGTCASPLVVSSHPGAVLPSKSPPSLSSIKQEWFSLSSGAVAEHQNTLICPRFSHLSPRQHTLFSVSFLSLIFCNAMTDLGYLLRSLTHSSCSDDYLAKKKKKKPQPLSLEIRCRVALS
jgi:hypothetical protein